jgi:hypothetical protein
MARARSWWTVQRVVLVVALAVALAFLGRYLVTLGRPREIGWYAYAPLNSAVSPPLQGMQPWQQLLIWLGLVGVWALSSLWLLRPRQAAHSAGRTDTDVS